MTFPIYFGLVFFKRFFILIISNTLSKHGSVTNMLFKGSTIRLFFIGIYLFLSLLIGLFHDHDSDCQDHGNCPACLWEKTFQNADEITASIWQIIQQPYPSVLSLNPCVSCVWHSQLCRSDPAVRRRRAFQRAVPTIQAGEQLMARIEPSDKERP